MIMIVQTFATAMPILYLAGFLCFSMTYVSDKILFLRHYKNPPLYTKTLVINSIKIMEWGVPLHLSFGMFMLTHPNRFDYEYDGAPLFVEFGELIGDKLKDYANINGDRFKTVHGSTYCFFSMLLITIFLLDKFTMWFFGTE
jgi:hypothetical protein